MPPSSGRDAGFAVRGPRPNTRGWTVTLVYSEVRPGSLSPFPAQLLKRLEFPVTGLVEASAAVRGSGRELPPHTGQGGGAHGEPRGSPAPHGPAGEAPRPSQRRGRLGSPRTCFRQEPADAAPPESHSSTLTEPGVRGHVSGMWAAPWACWHRPGRGAGVSGRGAPGLQADPVPAEVQCGRPAGVREPPGAGRTLHVWGPQVRAVEETPKGGHGTGVF